MVVIDGRRVVANTTNLTQGKEIDGIVLVGRGPGASQLAQLRVGSTATVRWRLATNPAFAISGERVLLRRGKVLVTDDRILHPRTAVGVDQDSGEILLLAIDGRQTHSRGYTLVELARMMKRLGADAALNLDGGGSTTLVGRDRRGRVRVLNKPSDGSQRSIPEGIAVIYRKPR
jgi:exopolysaccharide biosynthesis protein